MKDVKQKLNWTEILPDKTTVDGQNIHSIGDQDITGEVSRDHQDDGKTT